MRRIPADSPHFKSIGYDPDKKVLELEFPDGNVYKYQDVPEFKFWTLREAESMEKYFNESIKGKFECVQVNSNV